MDFRLKSKTRNCKNPRRKVGAKFHDIGLGSDYMDITSMAQVTKQR